MFKLETYSVLDTVVAVADSFFKSHIHKKSNDWDCFSKI